MATIKKAQNGLAKGSKPGEMSGVQISDKDVMTHPQDFQHLKSIPKYKKMLDPKTNKYYPKKKAKTGGSFPDLNKDGKVTKADVLKGRGVIAKNGGSVSAGTKGQSKRVGPVDPKGAYTKVQKRTLAKAKTKASLTKDKQLGATKMKNGGCMKCGGKMSKKK
jgi:ribosomal protein L32